MEILIFVPGRFSPFCGDAKFVFGLLGSCIRLSSGNLFFWLGEVVIWGEENRSDWGGIRAFQAQGEGAEQVGACRDATENQAFEHRDLSLPQGLVAFESFGGGRIDAGGVDSDEEDSEGVKVVDELGGERDEVVRPLVSIGEGVGANEEAAGADVYTQITDLHARAWSASDLDDLGAPEVAMKLTGFDACSGGMVVVGCISMGAEMDGGFDAGELEVIASVETEEIARSERRIAGKNGGAFGNEGRNVKNGGRRCRHRDLRWQSGIV